MEQEKPHRRDPPQDQQSEEDDDLDDLGLFHKSSLREQQVLPLLQLCTERVGVKKFIDENNETHIGDYIQWEKIGQGSYGVVVRAKKDDQFYAIKIYSLLKLRSQKFFAADGSFANAEQMLQNEINIVKRLSHPNIVKCQEILYGGNYAYIVNQLCELGQIMHYSELEENYKRNDKMIDYLKQKYELQSPEDAVRLIFLQASRGIEYLHTHNITNRDIKVDNILCRITKNQGDDIKIADFTTVRYSTDDKSFFVCGTPGFRGPQQQFASSDGYSCKATDIWSLGVSLYTFYYQHFPFMADTEFEIDTKAMNQPLESDQHCPKWLKEVLEMTTKKDWKQRANIQQVIAVLAHSQ